ncbi:MAG: transglycosylase SLT domain-containing protein [Candidatus Hydrogenedens sp.]|nr:transglycosylase SLT domain-containing protein [Candidatus Hydrogenedens sp.]
MMLSGLFVVLCLAGAELDGSEAFLRGADLQRAGNYAGAIEQFIEAEAAGTALRPYAMLRIAACRDDAGDGNGAIGICRQVLQTYPSGPWGRLAEAQLYEVHAKRGTLESAVKIGESFMNVPVLPWWLEDVAWKNGESLLKVPGDEDTGYAYFRGVVENSIFPDKRLSASRKLMASASPRDRVTALKGMVRSSAFDEAAKSMEQSPLQLADAQGQPIPAVTVARKLAAQSAAERQAALAPILADETNSTRLLLAAVYAARKDAEAGNMDAALAMTRLLVDVFPAARETGDTVWWLAKRVESKQGYDAAVPLFELLATGCPTHFRADDTVLYMAEQELARGQRAKAEGYYERLGDTYADSRFRDFAYYKGAELAVELGQTDAAVAKFRKAVSVGPGRYYAHRALDRIGVDGGLNLRVDGSRPVLQVMPELREPLPPTPTLFRESVQYKRLQFFGRHGLDEGEWEALDLLIRLGNDPGQEIFYQPIAEAGFAHTALQYAIEHGWGAQGDAKTVARQRLELPRAYWDDAIALGKETGVDPYLMLAVAKQESTYRATVQSHAGATGVMQLMPSTAKWLVKVEDGIQDGHYDNLKSPANSLRLGAFYLRRMINTYDGNLVFAVAAYNGGPGNVNKWRRQFSTADLDAWIESIPFTETRDYVRKVLGYYAAYHSLYPPVEY